MQNPFCSQTIIANPSIIKGGSDTVKGVEKHPLKTAAAAGLTSAAALGIPGVVGSAAAVKGYKDTKKRVDDTILM